MRGGVLKVVSYGDNLVTHGLRNYVNNTYRDKIIEKFTLTFSVFTYKVSTIVNITNISKPSFLRKENKLERIIVYDCYSGNVPVGVSECYALVRVPADMTRLVTKEGSIIPIVDMDPKILFIIPNMSNCNATGVNTGGALSSIELTFKSFISSNGDNYKIILRDTGAANTLFGLFKSPPLEDGNNDTIIQKDNDNANEMESYRDLTS